MDELTAISNELALMKRQFDKRCGLLENRVELVRTKQMEQQRAKQMQSISIQPAPELTELAPIQTAPIQTAPKEIKVAPKIAKTKPKPKPKPKPSFVAKCLSYAAAQFTALLSLLITMMTSWAAPFIAVYQHYKARNMVAMFALMLAGVGFTVAGFGYLLQLLIEQSQAGGKVLGMAFSAVLTTGFGCWFLRKTKFTEFASSIVALGLLLGFTTIYFAGSVYQLLDETSTIVGYLLVAMAIHAVAHLTKSQWLSCLAIVGVSFLPLFDVSVDSSDNFRADWYLLAVGLVAMSCLYEAFKKSQLWLAVVTLASSIAGIELLIVAEHSFSYLIVFELFYGVFFAYVLMTLLTKGCTQNVLLTMVTFLVSFFAILIQLYPLVGNDSLWVISLNLLAAIALAFVTKPISKQVSEIVVVIAALWGIAAGLVYFSQDNWGLVWAVEGLALLWLAKRFASNVIAVKAQLLTGGALLYCIAAIAPYYPAPALTDATGIVLAVACVVICSVWLRLLSENVVKQGLVLLETLLVCVLIVGLIEAWFAGFSPLIIPLMQVLILWRAKTSNQSSLEYIVAGLLFFTAVVFAKAGFAQKSWFIADLSWAGRAALLSLALQMWGLAACYRKLYFQQDKQGQLANWAEKVRSIFYLALPVSWLVGAANSLLADVLAILWLSPLLALLVAKRFDSRRVDGYASVLLWITSALFILLMSLASAWAAVTGLVGFGLVYLGCFYLENKPYGSKLYQYSASFGYFAWGLMACHFIFEVLYLPLGSLLFACVYFGVGLFDSKIIALFARNYNAIVCANICIYLIAWLNTFNVREYVLVPLLGLVLMGIFKYFNRGCGAFYRMHKSVNEGQLLLQLFIGASYCTFLASGSSTDFSIWLAPSLIIHGVVMLFILQRHAINLKASFGLMALGVAKLIMVDINTALLSHKVMLFMGLGLFVLLASFGYQKLQASSDMVKVTEN